MRPFLFLYYQRLRDLRVYCCATSISTTYNKHTYMQGGRKVFGCNHSELGKAESNLPSKFNGCDISASSFKSSSTTKPIRCG